MVFSVSQMDLGIDRATLQQVSKAILNRATEKNSQYNVNTNTNFFQQRDPGIDLYKGNINSDVARQIAMNNSGMQIQLSQSAQDAIKALNSNAAQKVQQAVEGKMTAAVNEITVQEQKTPTPKFNSIISMATSKDKNGSNPFYHGELLMSGNSKKEEKAEDKSIYA